MGKFIMMVGLPGSGKSTFAKEIALRENAIIHSSDELRLELFGDADENDKNDKVFNELHKRVKNDLGLGRNVIYDATNISYKRRMSFLKDIKKYNCVNECYLVATPYEKCLAQNRTRERFVPEHSIKQMYMNFYVPQYYEGWDNIKILWNTEGFRFDTKELFEGENGLDYINQDNPHHTLTIGGHCRKCAEKVISKVMVWDTDIICAAQLHDIGKRFTKTFKNSKGEITPIAHYYQHHLVSAYDSIFYTGAIGLNEIFILNVANYVQWHMQPFNLNTAKDKAKLKSLVGDDAYRKIIALHEADEESM